MTYELLEESKWEEARELIEKHGGAMPSPGLAVIAVARNEEGKIEGLLELQFQIHMEPLILENPNVNYLRLVEKVEEPLRGKKAHYWTFVPNEHIAQMAAKAGMEFMPFAVFHKEI